MENVHNQRFDHINYLVRKRYITLLTKWQPMPVLISGDAALLRTIHANSLMFLFWRNLKLNWTLTLSECQAPNLSFLSAGVFERSPASKFGKLNKMTTRIKVNWIIDFEFLPIKRCYRGDDVIKKIFFSCSTKNDLTANTIYKVQSISSKASIFSFVPVMLLFLWREVRSFGRTFNRKESNVKIIFVLF